MQQGKVFLVGAGPGDHKLITIKGLECIKQADVLVYDRLVSKRLLSYVKEGCELIYGGKYPDHHVLRQEEINNVLVEKALEGKIVTRLKGGDPFVFGRGGEEAEALTKHGIGFEVVPGISSSVAVPAYAGIPVTHRNFTTSFAVITGHLEFNKAESAIEWEKIAGAHGTLIFLMGMEKLALIVKKLQENGRAATTPVALVRWGTTANQTTITGCLEDIVDKAKANNFGSPAVVVVGEVVNLREKLMWFENKPLFGKRILVTRTRSQASVLSDKLESLGAEVWEVPMIELAPPSDTTLIMDALRRLDSFTWLVFTSVNAVEQFFRYLNESAKDVRDLKGIKICAIGAATKQAVENYHIKVDLVPKEFVAEAVLDKLKAILNQTDRVLLPRAELAREVLPATISSWGIPVEVVPVYKTLNSRADNQGLIDSLNNGEVDLITFTSSSTVKHFAEIIGREKIVDTMNNIKVVCIGPITAQTARDAGLEVDLQAGSYTIDGLVDTIRDYYQSEH